MFPEDWRKLQDKDVSSEVVAHAVTEIVKSLVERLSIDSPSAIVQEPSLFDSDSTCSSNTDYNPRRSPRKRKSSLTRAKTVIYKKCMEG